MPGKKKPTSTLAVSAASEPCTALASMLSAKSARMVPARGLLRVGGAHQVAVLQDGVLAFEHLDHHRAGDHELHQVLEEGTLLVHGIELLGFAARQVGHPGGDDLQAGGLEAGVDLADDVLGHGVGLDDGEGAFDSHVRFPELEGMRLRPSVRPDGVRKFGKALNFNPGAPGAADREPVSARGRRSSSSRRGRQAVSASASAAALSAAAATATADHRHRHRHRRHRRRRRWPWPWPCPGPGAGA